MSRNTRFRPSVQQLDARMLMAGDVGDLTAEVETQEISLITPAVQSVPAAARGADANIWLEVFTCPDDSVHQPTAEATDKYFAEVGESDRDNVVFIMTVNPTAGAK